MTPFPKVSLPAIGFLPRAGIILTPVQYNRWKRGDRKLNENEKEKKTPATIDQEPEKTNNHSKAEGNKTSIGLTENVGGLLCYIFIIGLIFLFMEKENRFIRFHALQSVFTAIAIFLVSIVLGFIPLFGVIASLLLSPLAFALMIFMMYQAYQGNYYKLPFIGDIVENQLEKP